MKIWLKNYIYCQVFIQSQIHVLINIDHTQYDMMWYDDDLKPDMLTIHNIHVHVFICISRDACIKAAPPTLQHCSTGLPAGTLSAVKWRNTARDQIIECKHKENCISSRNLGVLGVLNLWCTKKWSIVEAQ